MPAMTALFVLVIVIVVVWIARVMLKDIYKKWKSALVHWAPGVYLPFGRCGDSPLHVARRLPLAMGWIPGFDGNENPLARGPEALVRVRLEKQKAGYHR
jgi:hypothetical protein